MSYWHSGVILSEAKNLRSGDILNLIVSYWHNDVILSEAKNLLFGNRLARKNEILYVAQITKRALEITGTRQTES